MSDEQWDQFIKNIEDPVNSYFPSYTFNQSELFLNSIINDNTVITDGQDVQNIESESVDLDSKWACTHQVFDTLLSNKTPENEMLFKLNEILAL